MALMLKCKWRVLLEKEALWSWILKQVYGNLDLKLLIKVENEEEIDNPFGR